MGTIFVDNIKDNVGGKEINIGDGSLNVASDGSVGIRTTSPSDNLEITPSADEKGLTLKTTSNIRPYINLESNRSSAGNNIAQINFLWNGTDVARIIGVAGSDTSNKDDGHITFQTASAGSTDERMRVTSAGFVGIGTDSPVNALHVNNSGNTIFCLERNAKSSGSGFAGFNIEGNSQFTIAYDNGAPLVIGSASNPSTQAGFTNHFKIDSDGTLTATDTSIGSISDERLKKNIADYTYDLEKFKQYKPKTFDWKNPSNHNGKTGNRGFLAQDVKSIDDKWVGELEITEKNPDYGIISDNVSLTSKLGDKDTMYISIIQQLITKVETLEAKVKTLESK